MHVLSCAALLHGLEEGTIEQTASPPPSPGQQIRTHERVHGWWHVPKGGPYNWGEPGTSPACECCNACVAETDAGPGRGDGSGRNMRTGQGARAAAALSVASSPADERCSGSCAALTGGTPSLALPPRVNAGVLSRPSNAAGAVSSYRPELTWCDRGSRVAGTVCSIHGG